MKRTISVDTREGGLWLDADICFAQVPAWYGHVTRDLKLSLIRPMVPPSAPLPCIVWICGGAWLQLDRNAHLPNFVDLARQGFIIASVEYRTSNEAVFPAQLQDVKAAIRYLRAQAARFDIDPQRIGVMGESAGGHLASLAATTCGVAGFDSGAHLDQGSEVQAACPWYTPVAFPLRTAAQLPPERIGSSSPEDLLLGAPVERHPELARQANPVTYISARTPPFLLLHGTADSTVPAGQSEILHDALVAKGIPAELYLVAGAEHASLEFFQPAVMRLISEFFVRTLGPRARKPTSESPKINQEGA